MYVMMMLKVTQKQSFTLSSVSVFFKIYYLDKVWGFFEWNFNISFCQISNLSFYFNKNELSENC